MSLLDRLLRRGPRAGAAVVDATQAALLTEDDARLKRLALWEEIQDNPTPDRAAQIAREAEALLAFFNRDHPLHDNINELIQVARATASPPPMMSDE